MSNTVKTCDLRELACLLRQERLFVRAEQESVEQLSCLVSSLTSDLNQIVWLAAQQRRNLQQLVLARQDCLPALQAQRGYSLDCLRFIEAAPVLGYTEAIAYGEFLVALRDSPELLAGCLAAGDKSYPDRVHGILHSVSAGLYGSCMLAADKRLVLKLLRQLAQLQLSPSDNPRRLLRHGTCAFARLFNIFHENLHSAQLFLTAALHGPIMALLAEDEVFLDVDPEKSSLRCATDVAAKHRRHRDWTVQRLVALTQLFLNGLRDHVFCFPPSVSWLLRQLVAMFTKAAFLNEKEIYEICTDMLLTHFICPAIVNPEPHGIIEAPVSNVARFNLMQVASILQVLAMSKYEEWDPKAADLYSQFHPECAADIISSILGGGSEISEVPVAGEADLDGVSRSVALMTASQLNALVCFLQTILGSDSDLVEKRQLENLLSNLPISTTNGHKESVVKTKQSEGGKKHNPLNKGARTRTNPNGEALDEAAVEAMEPVLMIRLSGETDTVELLTETKVLEMEEKQSEAPALCVVEGQDIPDSAATSQSHEKRTRFSLSHDEGSIGNTSDNLEAISEAASNHSVASSLESENEDQNDNLSDMVSANVSGRGSPNISGRDTPSSQITEGEAADRPRPAPHPVTKQSRSDIDDKFGKFEIRKQEMLGDETVSLVSDTWSTDVLASDSETVEQVDRFRRPPDDGPPHPFIQHSLDISETASEAWSTDVMASDSERLTEVDTDDTASVARSDDTAPSEPGEQRHRLEEPGTPPPATFRPISRPDEPLRVSLAVPPSPTRCVNDASGNVTGRGGAKADYKRRTQEFVGGLNKPYPTANLDSFRMIHVIDKMDTGRSGRGIPRSPHTPIASTSDSIPLETSLSALSLVNHVDEPSTSQSTNGEPNYDESTPPASFLNTFQPIPQKFPESKIKLETDDGDRVFVSTTSLASTSSSSSNAAAAASGPPTAETKHSAMGAIPKSISFDKTADKDFLDDKKQKKGFFGNLKMSFKNRKFKKGDGFEGYSEGNGLPRPRRIPSDDSRMHNGDVEDILAKYRGKAVEEPDLRVKRAPRDVEEENRGLSDESLFINAKRKLRIVFSRADLHSWPASAVREKELISFLQLQLAEARSLQNRTLVSQLHETLRCVQLFDADGCRRLVAGLRSDLAVRTAYATYLTRLRQILLSRATHLNRLTERVRVETRLCTSFLLDYCVRMFLERREDRCRRFTLEFRGLSLADEKTDLLDSFLAELTTEMDRDPIWIGSNESQRANAQGAVETALLSRVYPYAFYPNGDGDVSRDQVFHEHVKKLASVITPNHKDLQIPKRFHGECPWPSAQADITSLASYKTPRDKVACVRRCAETIMNLLALASEGSVPAADEFLPVLVYVVITANPPALLSTIQYVDSFSSRLTGEDQYWWTQFCSAIELIKTMDYNV